MSVIGYGDDIRLNRWMSGKSLDETAERIETKDNSQHLNLTMSVEAAERLMRVTPSPSARHYTADGPLRVPLWLVTEAATASGPF